MTSSRKGSLKKKLTTQGRISALLVTVIMVLSALPLAVWDMTATETVRAQETASAEVSAMDPSGINQVDKDMTLYFHYVNDSETSKTIIDKSTWYYFDTTQEWNNVNTTIRVSAALQVLKWYQYPVLAGDFTVDSFDFIMWIKRIGGAGHPNVVVKIYEKTKDGETLVHTKNWGAGPGIVATPTEQHYGSDAAWGGHTFKAGSSIVMSLEMNPGAPNTFDLLFDTASADSRVVFTGEDSMDAPDVYLLDHDSLPRMELDPTETDKSVSLRANMTDPLGGYDIKWVNITLKSPSGSTILNNVSMTKVIGNRNSWLNVYQKSWDYTGQPAGTYKVTIWALDNNGYFWKFYDGKLTFGNYYVRKDATFTIGEVRYMNVKVVDSTDLVMAGATVLAKLNYSRTLEAAGVTDGNGLVNFTLFSAEYLIEVVWFGTLVANQTRTLSNNVTAANPLKITSRVYYPNLKFEDGHAVALENTSVTVVFPNGTISFAMRSNTTGELLLGRVSGGPYHIIARWRDVVVHDSIFNMTVNGNYTFDCSVHYMTIIARDDLGGVLPGAQIVIANNTTAIVFDSKVTNLTGAIKSRLPAGPYDMAIYWQNSRVFDKFDIAFNDDMTIDAFAGIYVLNLTALDGHTVPVSKARILVMTAQYNLLESNYTDEDGMVHSRLPAGTHVVRAYWRDVLVNETLVDINGNHDLNLDLAIHYPTIRVLDDQGDPLPDARVDLYYSGTSKLYGTAVTDQDGKTLHRVPATSYDICVTWRDRLVNLTGGVPLASDAILTINAAVYNLALQVVDPHDVPVENAMVHVSFANGESAGVYDTGPDGSALLLLPSDKFNITVFWYGRIIKEVPNLVLDHKTDLTIVADIWYAQMTPVDSAGIPLPDALVSVRFSNSGPVHASSSTGQVENVTFRLPEGGYDISVSWADHIVYDSKNVGISKDVTLFLDCSVYYLNVTVVDSKNLDLEGASIAVMNSDDHAAVTFGIIPVGTAGMDAAMARFRLPADTYILEASWSGAIVNTTQNVTLTSDLDLELKASVFYITMKIVDSKNIPVVGAKTTVSSTVTRNALASSTSDSIGMMAFRLPGAFPMNITASWMGVTVLDQVGYVLDADKDVTFSARVYYATMTIQDTQAKPLGGANVALRLESTGEVFASGASDANGTLWARLPGADYILEASWRGVLVYAAVIELTGDSNQVLKVRVSYMTLSITDSRNAAIDDAWVVIAHSTTGATMDAGITDGNGTVTFRLPHATYIETVRWAGVEVSSGLSKVLDKDLTWSIPAHVYYMQLTLVDDRNLPLEQSLVTIKLQSGADLAKSIITWTDGKIETRLPHGSYTIDATWRGVTVVQGMTEALSADVLRTINARVFYLSVNDKDASSSSMKGANVRVSDSSGYSFGEGMTDKRGRVEFRLPVGTYVVTTRFTTTYQMTPYDRTHTVTVQLTSSQELVIKFKDYPPAIHTTNSFAVATLSLLLVVLLVALFLIGMKRRKAAAIAEENGGGDLAEYPPKVPKDGEDEAEDGSSEEEGSTPKDLDDKVKESEAPAEDTEAQPRSKATKMDKPSKAEKPSGDKEDVTSLEALLKEISSDKKTHDSTKSKKEVKK
jgi:hypothetical protein